MRYALTNQLFRFILIFSKNYTKVVAISVAVDFKKAFIKFGSEMAEKRGLDQGTAELLRRLCLYLFEEKEEEKQYQEFLKMDRKVNIANELASTFDDIPVFNEEEGEIKILPISHPETPPCYKHFAKCLEKNDSSELNKAIKHGLLENLYYDYRIFRAYGLQTEFWENLIINLTIKLAEIRLRENPFELEDLSNSLKSMKPGGPGRRSKIIKYDDRVSPNQVRVYRKFYDRVYTDLSEIVKKISGIKKKNLRIEELQKLLEERFTALELPESFLGKISVNVERAPRT